VDVAAVNGLYGQVMSVTDPNGAVTTIVYDPFGRKTRVTRPDASWTTWAYNYFGTLNSTDTSQHVMIDNSMGLTAWTYFDGFGRTIREKKDGPDGKTITTQTQYNNTGTVSQTSLPYFTGLETARWTTNKYDAMGRVIEVNNPDSTKVMACYNDGVTVGIDADGHRKRETKNAQGKLVKVEEYTGTFATCTPFDTGTLYATTIYQYDVLGNLLNVTDANSNTTTMHYDNLGRKDYMVDPDMGRWDYTYDTNGNLKTQKDAKNQTITFSYDALNRVTFKTGMNVSYVYDQATSTYPKGRLTTMTDASGSTNYFYDNLGRATRVVKTVDGTAYYTQTTYDGLGRISSMIYPDSETVSYGYDTGGNLILVSGSGVNYAAYSNYNALGQPGTLTNGNGVSTTYQYKDTNNRLQNITTSKAGTLLNLTYSYTNGGNISSITDGVDSNRNQTFWYDELNRLQQARSNSYGVPYYLYDKLGNITSKDGMSYTTAGPRPHAVTATSDGINYTYDANGNMTWDGTRTITYDYDNMPSSINTYSATTSFVYDGGGARVKKTTASGTTAYIGKLYECKAGTCSKYIFAGGSRIAQKVGTSISYYHQDHLGSSSIVTDSNGNKIEEVYYYPFGGTRADTGSVSMNHKYTSQEFDSETGLYYYNARYYNPSLGRFISPDTIIPDPSNPQAFNRYSYVLNNPIMYTDPSGHWSTGDLWKEGSRAERNTRDAWNRNRSDIEAGAIIVGTAAATWYCGGCGAAAILQGALAGEIAGGSIAYATGGDVLTGVVAGGVIGAGLGYAFTGTTVGITTAGNTGYAEITLMSDGYNGLGAAQAINWELAAQQGMTALGYGGIAFGSYEIGSAIASGLSGGGRNSGGGSSGGGGTSGGNNSGTGSRGGSYAGVYPVFNAKGLLVDASLETPLIDPIDFIAGFAGVNLWGYSYREGFQFALGRNLEVAPWGHRVTDNLAAQLPHYHRRIFGPNGDIISGGSFKWHRPWQNGW